MVKKAKGSHTLC
jgi:hypothetical protein